MTKQLLTTPAKDSDAFALLSGKEKTEANEHRQLESENLDRARASFRRWFDSHPDADAVEIREQGKKIEALFKKTPQELKEENAQRTLEAKAREKLRAAIKSRGQEELEKAKLIMSDKYASQLEYLKITFNLSEAEQAKAKELMDEKGYSLEDIVKYLQKK
jgi:hypothetical protein